MRRIAALGALAVLLLVLVVGQIVLPGIAASMLRDRLARSGQVLSVDVSAFPAIELLWHDADTVVVRMASYRSSTGHLTSLLDQAGGVGTLHASVGVLQAGLLTLHDASLSKQGSAVRGSASVSQSDLRAAIPFLQSVQLVGSGRQGLTLQGTANVVLATVTATALVHTDAGRLVITPNVPLIGPITLFADPKVAVESVGGSATSDGLALSARGVYR